MSVYKCKCGYEDDETTKCPACGLVTISCEDKTPRKQKAKSKKTKK